MLNGAVNQQRNDSQRKIAFFPLYECKCFLITSSSLLRSRRFLFQNEPRWRRFCCFPGKASRNTNKLPEMPRS